MYQSKIRNFSIIAHIDHGKSTLADRMLEMTGTISKRDIQPQFLDKLQAERERGITIKMQSVRMEWQGYILNLIDTPGHVDFSYEVSRALAACEGAILLVDASQGIQAQTLSHFYKATGLGLKIIPVINKIDLPQAQIEQTKDAMIQAFGFKPPEFCLVSGKSGDGVKDLLNKIVETIPAPNNNNDKKLRALIFDSFYDEHKGVIALIKVVDGSTSPTIKLLESEPRSRRPEHSRRVNGNLLNDSNLKKIPPLFLLNSGVSFNLLELGHIKANLEPTAFLTTGEVGYIATGIKNIKLCQVGDTVTFYDSQNPKPVEPLPGYSPPKPMVFADLYPMEPNRFHDFRNSLEKLALNDASLSYQPTGSAVLGAGFKCGFLGLLHLEITQERLSQEYGLEVFVTTPQAAFEKESEPWAKIEIFTPQKYMGNLMTLCQNRRGIYKNTEYLTTFTPRSLGEVGPTTPTEHSDYARLTYELPYAELISDFFDELKSLSSGFGSLDYQFLEYRKALLCQLDILINGKTIEPLRRTVLVEKAETIGRQLVERLKDLIPRHQFAIILQAAIEGKIIARADISALRKNVLAKLSGGHRERKDKLLEKQKKGKEKLKKFGNVEIPQAAFLTLLKKQG